MGRIVKIWHYTSIKPSEVGGVEKHLLYLNQELINQGHQVAVGLSCPFIPDIIHTHGDLMAAKKKLIQNRATKWIHIFHGTTLGRQLACKEYFSLSAWKAVTREFFLARQAHAGIAVGEHVAKEARRFCLFNKPLAVIKNGANPKLFQPLEKISDSQNLLFLGRSNDRVKNIKNILRACKQVTGEFPGFKLLAAPGIKNAPEFVINLGSQKSVQLVSLYSSCRGVILCSHYEGDSLVLHESKAMGLPILASEAIGCAETLKNYPNALLVSSRSPTQIAEGIRKILKNNWIATSQVRPWCVVLKDYLAFYKKITDPSLTS